MSSNEVVVSVEGLTKTFRIPLEASSGIKQKLVNVLKGKKGYREFTPLNDVNFKINKGDFFGIVGRNGSGKSTLLKTIAGIYNPDKGAAHVNGSLVPFIELGVGFNPELTGRENVFLNGALLGFSRREMEAMFDDIVDFAEIGDFMEEKLKNYSSGMQVRLAFSIAIRAQGDILLLDEVLAVGDEAFQRKCFEYFDKLKRENKTVILVTHDMGSVRKYCSRAILIENGKIIVEGSPEDVANQYTVDNFKPRHNKKKVVTELPQGLTSLVPEFEIIPKSELILKSNDDFEFTVKYRVTEDIPVKFGISLIDRQSGGMTSVFDDGIKEKDGSAKIVSVKKGTYEFDYKLPLSRFNNRDFMVSAVLDEVLEGKNQRIAYTSDDRSVNFLVRGEKHDGGLLKEKGEWVLEKNSVRVPNR